MSALGGVAFDRDRIRAGGSSPRPADPRHPPERCAGGRGDRETDRSGSEMGLILLEIVLEQPGGVQAVRALRGTLAAVETVLDPLHLPLPLLRQPAGGGGPAEHEAHPGTLVDLDPHRNVLLPNESVKYRERFLG